MAHTQKERGRMSMPELPELIKPDAPKGAKPRKNSSKTARVLGLLTSPLPTGESAPSGGGYESPVNPPAAVPAAPPPAPTPSDQAVEAQIRGALERELESELATQEASRSPAPPGSSRPVPAQDQSPALSRPVAIEPAAAETGGLTCLNVMQLLVEAKVDKYIRLFGLCSCQRCRIDVIALTLTGLPAKYIVTREPQTAPLLSVYEEKYNAAIVSQLINACKLVLEHPRHDL